ncbi:MAG TPA: hypothetical protein VMU49_09475 [Candidatus Acidoferrales bacterium]|nr:hypothetical protein [Candidatus Acidoferrales bacterium]
MDASRTGRFAPLGVLSKSLCLPLLVLLAACSTGATLTDLGPVTPPPLQPLTSLWTPSPQPRSSGTTQAPEATPASPLPSLGQTVGSDLRHGYDASYPQCAAAKYPAAAEFAVIGVNGGLAFTANSCLQRQWGNAIGVRSLYLNSGFNPDNYAKVGAGCRHIGLLIHAPPEQQIAYAIGCGEALQSLNLIADQGITPSRIFWIDVESSNSWSTQDLSLNRYALEGEFDQLTGRGFLVGVYSAFADWAEVTGNWTAPTVSADWVAQSLDSSSCRGRGFSDAPVWLRQETTTWPPPAAVDSDWIC